MNNNLVTIITTCYNGEKHIISHIEAILNQSHKKIQYIFVNDGSTDNTEDIILSYENKFIEKNIKFKYIKQENKGQASAINNGLKYTEGMFFSCIDSDDIILPTYIEEMSDFLTENIEHGICFPIAEFIDFNTKEHLYYRKREIKKGYIDKFVDDMIVNNRNLPAFSSFMIRMSDFIKYTPSKKIYEGLSGQNPQLILPIAYNCKIGYIDNVLIKIMVRNNSDSRTDIILKTYNWDDLYCNTIKQIENMPEYEKAYYFTEIKKRFILFRKHLAKKENIINKIINKITKRNGKGGI